MHLASINSQEEQDAATATISAKYMAETETWIGLSRLQDKDFWYWSDGSSLLYENWKTPLNTIGNTYAGNGELDDDWKCVANGFGDYDHSNAV